MKKLSMLFLLALLCGAVSDVEAAIEKTVTVRPSCAGYSDCYTSLADAEAGERADLVALDRQLNIEVYRMLDTAAVAFATGWTTDPTHYVRVYAPPSERHNGTAGTGYRLILNGSHNTSAMRIALNHIRLEYLEIKNVTTIDGQNHGIWFSNSAIGTNFDVRIIGCIIHDCSVGGTSAANGIKWNYGGTGSAGKFIVANSLIYGNKSAGIFADGVVSAHNTYIYNNTIVRNGTYGVWKQWNQTVYATNNYAGNNTTADYFASTGSIIKTTTASSDATGTAGLQNIPYSTANFGSVAVGSENLHLVEGSALLNAGTDLSGDAVYPFSDDIDAQQRAVWDIGADESVAPSGWVIISDARGVR